MKHHAKFLVLLAVGVCAPAWTAVRADSYPKLSPFSAIRWVPNVEIDGKWYALEAVGNQPVEKIIKFSKQRHGNKWAKRFGEDLVQVLTEMGHPPGKTVSLTVRNLETGSREVLQNVPMTRENRARILNPPDEPGAVDTALDAFQRALNAQWAYRYANDADFDTAINLLRTRMEKNPDVVNLGVELQKIIAMGIDGHSGINFRVEGGEYLPFVIEPLGDRFVAIKPDRSEFLRFHMPYITTIDGIEVEAWCRAASVLVPKGSPQYVRQQCLRMMRNVDCVRTLLNLPIKDSLTIQLSSHSGKSRETSGAQVASRRPLYGIWPARPSGFLQSGVGYLRLKRMNDDALREIETWMPRFHDSPGLIVDVRDNGGGSREVLRLLYSYLVTPSDPPRAFTAARYRLFDGFADDHLAQRFMYSKDSKVWTDQERKAIESFQKSFKPEWSPPDDQFSEWHYMVLNRIDAPGVYHFDKPVIVLQNEKCFSATDIFLAGLKGMKNVTLIGATSGGGSALSQRVVLGMSKLRLRIASMASFQADGKLFDGNGVAPDIGVEQTPEYFIGGKDKVLEAAISRITRASVNTAN